MKLLKRVVASISLFTLLVPVSVYAVKFEDDIEKGKQAKPDAYFNFAPADAINGNLGGGAAYTLPGVAKTDPRAIITNVISIISGFLGIIAVVIIMISGFQWMTAGGDEDAVKKAQTRLVQGVIGLILILSTWSIGYYVVNTLSASIFK